MKKIHNSKNYASAPFEMTPTDLAIIFDELNIGIQRQRSIITSIWDNDKWILQRKYWHKNKRQKFINDVLYQIDYLYNKAEIDASLRGVIDNANELGISISPDKLSEDYSNVSKFFKQLWIKLKFINATGSSKAKIRTILDSYGYKRRTDKFNEYFLDCLCFYGITAMHNGEKVENLLSVPIDDMITFYYFPWQRRKRPRKAKAEK